MNCKDETLFQLKRGWKRLFSRAFRTQRAQWSAEDAKLNNLCALCASPRSLRPVSRKPFEFSSLFQAPFLHFPAPMRKIFNILLITTLVLTACGSSAGKFFSKKTPHEKYADKHEETPEGRAWLATGKQSPEYPVEIELPYRQQGYFQPGKPRSVRQLITASPTNIAWA